MNFIGLMIYNILGISATIVSIMLDKYDHAKLFFSSRKAKNEKN